MKPGPKQRTLDFIKEGAPCSFTRENLLYDGFMFLKPSYQIPYKKYGVHSSDIVDIDYFFINFFQFE